MEWLVSGTEVCMAIRSKLKDYFIILERGKEKRNDND